MVPFRPWLLHPFSISSPSLKFPAREEGNSRHIFMRDIDILHHRLHTTHQCSHCKLQPLENPYLRSIAVFSPHLRYRVCRGQSLCDQPRLYGSSPLGWIDIHGLRSNDNLVERHYDKAGEWKPSPDCGTVHSGQLLRSIRITTVGAYVHKYRSLVYGNRARREV